MKILVLENPGVNENEFNALAKKVGLKNEFIWTDLESIQEPEEIEGIINVKAPLSASTLSTFKNLKFIGVAFTGYDSIDREYCEKKKIAVYNVPAYSTNSVAELTLGLAISLLRDIPKTDEKIRQGSWTHPAGLELCRKKIGIVGTGDIGIRVAELFKAFGCEIFAWSRSEVDQFKKLGGNYLPTLEALLKHVDIVTLHIPSNNETINLIDEKALSKMQPHSYLINTARGAIVDEEALAKALENGVIAGSAIDVFQNEPIENGNLLVASKKTVLTPHIAYKTKEALKRRAEVTIKNILSFTEGKNENKCY